MVTLDKKKGRISLFYWYFLLLLNILYFTVIRSELTGTRWQINMDNITLKPQSLSLFVFFLFLKRVELLTLTVG